MEKENNLLECCASSGNSGDSKKKTILTGLMYGTIPHIGCIMFIIGAVLGVTVLMQFFKPLLMNRYFFHYLIGISVGFATLSSYFYLKKQNSLSLSGIKKRRGYLYVMYGSTIGINIVLFFFIFPYLANVTGNVSALTLEESAYMKISVDIPCPGHAPLISSELATIEGVEGSKFSFPNDFEVYYDSSLTNPGEILSLEVFEEYAATVLDSSAGVGVGALGVASASAGGCAGGCGGAGDCGGGCGSPSCDYNK
jgi:hypothetical protein